MVGKYIFLKVYHTGLILVSESGPGKSGSGSGPGKILFLYKLFISFYILKIQ